MEEEAKAFLRTQLEAGKSFDEARREMISQGHGTAGFDAVYQEIAKDLGIKNTSKQLPPQTSWEETVYHEDTSLDIDPNQKLPGLVSILKFGLKLTKNRLAVVMWATLLTSVAYGILLFVPEEPTPYIYGIPFLALTLMSVAAVIFIMLVSVAALVYTLARSDDKVSYAQGLLWSQARIGSIFWLGFLSAVITLTSFVALVLPGFIFAILNVFSLLVLINDDQRGTSAIIRSVDLVMGAFWGIVGRLLALALILIPIAGLLLLLTELVGAVTKSLPGGEFIMVPVNAFFQMLLIAFSTSTFVYIYNYRVKNKPFFDASLYRGLRWLFRLLALLGVLIMLGAIAIGSLSLNAVFQEYQAVFDVNNKFNQAPYELDKTQDQFDDLIVNNRVNTAFLAAQSYRVSMRTFEGACDDVVVEEPAVCLETGDSLVVYAETAGGTYYCRDISGFKGLVDQAPQSGFGCQ